MRIYRNRWHLAATFFIIVLPLVYLYAFARLSHLAVSGLAGDMGVSLIRMIVAYLIAAVLGWGSAVLFYRGPFSVIALPIFDVLQCIPTFAVLPLVVMVLGPSNVTVVLFLILAIVWPIFFSVVSSLKLIRQDWQEAAQIARLNGWDYFRLFLWPASLSGLTTGTIVGLGDGWEALIATEIIIQVRSGLGIFFNAHTNSVSLTLFGMLGLLLVIFVINKLLWLPLLEKSHLQLEG